VIKKLRTRLGWKIFGTYLMVILIGILVLASTVEVVIPNAFDRHMVGMGPMGMDETMMGNMDLFQNFRAAMNEALALAALAAIIVAVAFSLLMTRQVVAPVSEMLAASQTIADGHYENRVRVPGDPGNGHIDELGQLAISFNQMTERLEETESIRRQLIGDVSHELLTPLTAVKGSMEGLIDGVLPAEVETFQQIHREADRMQRLVMDLQELSRVEAGIYSLELKSVSVKQMLDTLRDRMSRQFMDKGVSFKMEIPSNLSNVMADEHRIGQVLLNLAGNALQYTPSGGTVSVSVSQTDGELQLSVIDTGIGLVEEQVNRIFDRFYRVDKSRSRVGGGSGIGLTIAKHFVVAHGGRIWAESQGLGKGSNFSFTLPLAK